MTCLRRRIKEEILEIHTYASHLQNAHTCAHAVHGHREKLFGLVKFSIFQETKN